MPTEYDSDILQDYADNLYAQARGIIVETAFQYGIGGAIVGGLIWGVGAKELPDFSNLGLYLVIIIAAILAWAGVLQGRRKAFNLKVEAQKLLCQRQIEINTRSMSHKPTVEEDAPARNTESDVCR